MRPPSAHLPFGPPRLLLAAAALAALLVCLPAPLVVEGRVAAAGVTVTYPDGFIGDIFGPDTIYASRTFCCVRSAMASYFPRLTTGGVPRLTLTTPRQRMFTLGGPNGYTIIGEDGIYLWNGPDIVPFTLTATDGYSTIVKHVNISFAPKAQFYLGGNFVLDSNPTVGAKMASTISCGGGATYTAKYSTNLWTVTANAFATTPQALPLNQHWGRTDVVAVVSFPEDTIKRFPLFIIQEVEPVIALNFTIPLVNILPVGTAVGKLTWYSDAGVKSFTSLDATTYFSVSSSGDLLIAAPLVVGTNQQWRVQLVSNSGLTVTETLKFSVLAGKLWPSSSISFTPLPLDNHKRAQPVGQPTITAFKPTSWSLYNRNNLASFTLFDIDPVTGFVQTGKDAGNANYPGKLPARTHQITITASDGINMAKATFDVPVTKIVGPTYHVGRNQSKIHPPGKRDKDGIYPDGSGFETLAEAAHNCMNGGADLKPGAVGFTILIYYDSDPNYYANDNGLRTQDYGLARGWLGPGTIRAADLNGPRPRVGGYVGKVNSGNDMGSKGFFNIGDGDITIQGLEISWCNGGGDPYGGMVGGTLYGGISCIRKNGHTSGDIILEGNYVHSANNCFEGGAGPFDVYIRNNVMGNAGTEYVSAGATHANYVGGNPYVEATGNLIYNTIAGHNFKTRAYSGLIKGNRIYDGERGGASAQIDIPTGGVYVIEDNDIMKGPNQQSYAAILFNAEGSQEGRPQSLIVRNNRISVLVPPGNHQGDPAGVALTRVNFHQYAPGPFLMENNQWYMSPAGRGRHILKAPYGDGGYPQPDYVETGSVFLDEPFPLNFADPGTARPPAPRLGDTPLNYDGNGDGDIPNMINGMMVDCGTDDMRVYAGAPNGTVVGRCRAAGSAYFQNSRLHKDYEFPFPTGAAWRILPQAEALGYYGNKIPVAPANRYVIHPDTGVITTGTTVNMTQQYSRFDFIIVEAKPKSGPLVGQPVWMRQYIVTTSDSKTAVDPGQPSNNDSNDPPGAGTPAQGGPESQISAISAAPHAYEGYSHTLLLGATIATAFAILQ